MGWFTGLRRFHRGFWRFWSKIGRFTDVYDISPRFLGGFDRKYWDFDVYGVSPRFLICFQRISNPISVEVMAQMHFAGKLTSILHRSPHAICFPQCSNAAVYAISPRLSWSFHNMFSQFCRVLSALVLFAGKIAYRLHPGLRTLSVRNVQLFMFMRHRRSFVGVLSPTFANGSGYTLGG